MPPLPKQPRPTNRHDIRQAWHTEIDAATRARSLRERGDEWFHLEQAHIVSQPLAGPHIRTHLAMLAYALRHRDRREITGQIIRTVVAGPGSLTRRYPLGNTGGANVNALTPMPIVRTTSSRSAS